MSIVSMTGFSRIQGHDGHVSWTWEARSVNSKGREVRCRLPTGFDTLEAMARERANGRFQRGNINIGLTLHRIQSASGYRINTDLLDRLVGLLPHLRTKVPNATPPTLDGLLAVRGIVEPIEEEDSEEARAALEKALLVDLDRAFEALAAMRAAEGANLKAVLDGLLDRIEDLRKASEGCAAAQPMAVRDRFLARLKDLMAGSPPLSEERLAQEIALLAGKADVREELDRLAAHVDQARGLLAGGGAVGRKLDFLCQEFNREANTLCSKSGDVELTRIGLDLKATIEQFREQVQNIE
ncbi:MAG: YicC family protein [Magnetospirillum sp. WYHS-4]